MLLRQAEWLIATVQRPKVFVRTLVVLTAMHNVYWIPGAVPFLQKHMPWLLLSLSTSGPSRAAAATVIPLMPYLVLGFIRLGVPKLIFAIAALREEMRSAADDLEGPVRWYDKRGINALQRVTLWTESAGWGARFFRWLGYARVDSAWIYMIVRKGHRWKLLPWVLTVMAVELLGWWWLSQWIAPHFQKINTLITIVVVCCLLKWAYKKMTANPVTNEDDMATLTA